MSEKILKIIKRIKSFFLKEAEVCSHDYDGTDVLQLQILGRKNYLKYYKRHLICLNCGFDYLEEYKKKAEDGDEQN